MDLSKQLAQEINWPVSKVTQTINLLDEGNTIPFIARYRKEVTGEMDEVVLRQLVERLGYLRNLEKRKEEVLKQIEEQGKLTENLKKKILKAQILQEVEDLYLPYRPKRKTRASKAKEKGLESLATAFLKGDMQEKPEILGLKYINPDLGVENLEDALSGALDIIAEIISEDAELRKIARKLVWQKGIISSQATDKKAVTPYEMYYDYQEGLKKIPPHRILAINRGEKEKCLQVKIIQPEEEILQKGFFIYVKNAAPFCRDLVEKACQDGYKRLMAPALEREFRKELTEKAEEQAIKVFAKNLHSLLLQPPVKGKKVLGIDPSFRTGCKVAVVDETGKVLETKVIYPHAPQNRVEETNKILRDLIHKWSVDIITIGNGTASRETELIVAQLLTTEEMNVQYIIVSEAGASVYSASEIAREEFPDFDVSLRSAVSIARRLQDPLAELVKIEPKAVGVGQYQHDLTPKRLDESLKQVVESCVNLVGVDINTASSALLQYVAGLNKTTAENIVKEREEKGRFMDRKELLDIPRLGKKAFEQCAGFIRVPEGENPLDNTPVHPESYKITQKLLNKLNFSLEDLSKEKLPLVRETLQKINLGEMAEDLKVGLPTLKDIVEALQKPGLDPREELPPPLFRKDVLKMEDLKAGMVIQGTVRNVVDFGAFVDIGVEQDGLIHISQFGRYIRHPLEVVAVGDIIKVKILEVDLTRGRISLTRREF